MARKNPKSKFHRRSGMTRIRGGCSLLLAAFGIVACGPQFDPPSQLKSLRVLGVKKDDPYARVKPPDSGDVAANSEPDNVVEMTMAWQDARAESDRSGPIERLWFAGCDDPPGDTYFSCLLEVWLTYRAYLSFGPGELTDGESWSPSDEPDVDAKLGFINEIAPEIPVESRSELLPLLDGLSIGRGDRFAVTVPPDLIERHLASTEPGYPPYGLSYVFFTLCDGRIDIAPDWTEEVDITTLLTDATRGFPLACYDRDSGEERGPDNYVAGYSSYYAYQNVTNHNPVVDGFEIDGQPVPASSLCIGLDCSNSSPTGVPDPCEDPESFHLAACDQEQSGGCPRLSIKPVLDRDKNSEMDELSTNLESSREPLLEQMWIKYFADFGDVDRNVKRLQDAIEGWFDDFGTKWRVPKRKGPVHLWSLVYDNRGGIDWARVDICLE